MPNKIKIEICCGTTCYMLGAASLLRMEDIVPEEWKEYLDISAIPCLETCTTENLGGAPFVRINGKLMANASLESVSEAICNILNTEKKEKEIKS